MIRVFDGDLLDSGANFICHQVNCQGVMGSGVAKQIKEQFPNVYEQYKTVASSEMLGHIQPIQINEIQYVCNFFAQDNYGYNGKQYTNLEALRQCFKTLKESLKSSNWEDAVIAMPWKIGCVRGGADWEVVYQMIEEEFVDFRVELWRLDKG